MIWLLIGFVCFLLVLGAIFTGNPLKFALSGLAVTGALAFVSFVIFIIYILSK
jgi:hypothetical protein